MKIKTPLAVFILFALLALLQAGVHASKKNPIGKVLTFHDTSIAVEIADTDAKREKGLGGRSFMPRDRGMLFTFPTSDRYRFWMKDMEFPLDIIWLDEAFTVVYLKEDISTSTYPELFAPEKTARYVLEVNAGTVKRLGLQVGDQLLSRGL